MTISEGNLIFNFPIGWVAVKYDDTSFYRDAIEKTGAELSAVDIIASSPLPIPRLVMIEVKDFRGHAPENRHRQSSGELLQEIIRKGLHSIIGIFAGTNASHTEFLAFHPILASIPHDIELNLFRVF